MKSKILLLALLFLFSRSYSQWEIAAQDVESNSFYINPLYISEVKDDNGNYYLKAWVKYYKKKYKDLKGKKYDNVEVKVLYYVDCINLRDRMLSMIYYKSTGEIISSGDLPLDDTNPWRNVIPETVHEAFFKKICSLKK